MRQRVGVGLVIFMKHQKGGWCENANHQFKDSLMENSSKMVRERKHKDVECGRVYRIYDVRDPSVTLYVGSTEKSINGRFATHISHPRNKPMMDYMLGNDLDNFKCELLQQLDNTTRALLHQTEQGYIDRLMPRFNKHRAFLTAEQSKQQCRYHNQKRARTCIICYCGKRVSLPNVAAHRKSKKHQAYIALEGLRI